MSTIDLNSDLGEGHGSWAMGDDPALLEVVTSANVACGFHAGDPTIMRQVCQNALAAGVSIGAHVSYRDLTGFGRRFMDIDPLTLEHEVIYQLAALEGIARVTGQRVRYVKPHGALYNAIVEHEVQAGAVVEAIAEFDASLAVLGLPGSAFLRLAREAGLRTVQEAFADRAYTPAGHLVPRSTPGAVLHDPALIAARCVAMATGDPIQDINGDPLILRPDSICVHGDTAGAVAIARAVRGALEDSGLNLAPFTAEQ